MPRPTPLHALVRVSRGARVLEHRTRRPVLSPCPSHARPAPCPHRCARSGGVGAGCFLWLYETTARTALQVRGDAPSNESFVLDHRGFHRIREYLPHGTPLGDAVGVQAWCVGAVGREEPAKRCLPHTLPFDCRPRGGRVAHPSSAPARRPRALAAGVGRFSCHGHHGHHGHP